MKNKENLSKIAMALSVVAVVLAAIDTLAGTDVLGLAGTQWILVGIVMAIYAVYLGTCSCGCCTDKKE
ncbi:MAG: hypothetical protein WCX17_02725 [Parcubacteria group bacterium]|jgi:membrane-bound ClpP family serine protease